MFLIKGGGGWALTVFLVGKVDIFVGECKDLTLGLFWNSMVYYHPHIKSTYTHKKLFFYRREREEGDEGGWWKERERRKDEKDDEREIEYYCII